MPRTPVFPNFLLVLLAVQVAAQAPLATNNLLREAARLDEEGKCGEAERRYRQALAAGRPTLPLLNNFGNHFIACGEPEKARHWFEQVLKSNPNHPNANLQLARVELAAKNAKAALAHLERVSQGGAEPDLLRAEALYSSGQKQAAAAVFQKIEGAAPSDPAIAFQLGLVYGRLELYGQAENAFNRVLSRFPNDPDVLINVGRAAARAGRFDRGERALEAALRVRPNDAQALSELGLLNASRKDFTRAVYYLAQAARVTPTRPEILLALARASEGAGFYGDAALAYEKYLALRPADETARRDRALMQGLTETRVAEAIGELENYVRKHPGDPAGHFGLAQLRWRDQPEQAVAHLTQAIGAKRGFAPALLARGWLLSRLGKTAEALPDLEAANAAAPGNTRVMVELGRALIGARDVQRAERVLRAASKAAPNDPDVLLQLGRALMMSGQEAEAQRTLEQYQSLRGSGSRGPRKEAGMIALAGLPPREAARREIERLTREAATHPGDAALQASLAALLLTDGQTDRAVAAYRDLLARPQSAQLWRDAGRALIRAGQFELAREFLESLPNDQAARLDLSIATLMTSGAPAALAVLDATPAAGRDAEYLLTRARVLIAAGSQDEGRQALISALQAGIKDTESSLEAARLLLRVEPAAGALHWLKSMASAAPQDPDLQLLLGVANSLNGDRAAADAQLASVEVRWPEWDSVYIARGLSVLAGKGNAEIAKKNLAIALAAGTQDPAAACGMAKLEARPAPDPRCECVADLRRWVTRACTR